MQTNPATPAQAAAPGNDAKVITTPSAPVTTGSEGKVTIDLKEYRDLQRAKARTLSFEKRTAINRSKPQASNDGDPANAGNQAVADAEARASDAERRALAAQVKAGINEILSRDEFKALPASTRALIARNPAMLSEADNVEEALLDIEDFVREQVVSLDAPGTGSVRTTVDTKGTDPVGHETPAAPGTAPAHVDGIELEDPSKLPPEQRSRAVLRNAIKKKAGIK